MSVGRTLTWFMLPVRGMRMERFNASDIYKLGKALGWFKTFNPDSFDSLNNDERLELHAALHTALSALGVVMHHRAFKLTNKCQEKARELYSSLADLMLNFAHKDKFSFGFIPGYIEDFEDLFFDDCMAQDLYNILQVRAYKTLTLLEEGEKVISPALIPKLERYPKVLADIREATRTLACGFWTASGFHMARATECLLQEYYKQVKGAIPRKATWVVLCRTLRGNPDESGVATSPTFGKQTLVKSVQTLGNDLRNPLIHPEHSLDEYDGVLLFDGCVAAINGLLAELA